ncbi:MAG TPA: nitrogen fixation protein NifM [Gammaproteobacteria bacterium]
MSEASALCNYFRLRGALLRYQQLPWQLNAAQQADLARAVSREEQLVRRALAAPEANDADVEQTLLDQTVASLLATLAPRGDLEQLLGKAGLQVRTLATAVDAELRAATVLERLMSAALPSPQEVQRWFEAHPAQFVVPERREAFQILITVNESYPENRREVARQRIKEVARQVQRAPESFGALALGHSECPSAVEAGRLGVMVPGHLYPELDRALFSLQSGAVSEVVESPLGFHLLRCGVIEPSRRLAWEEVQEPLTQRIAEKNRKRLLQQWLTESRDPSGALSSPASARLTASGDCSDGQVTRCAVD